MLTMFNKAGKNGGFQKVSGDKRRSTSTTMTTVMALLALGVSGARAVDVIVDDSSPLVTYSTPTGSWTVHAGVATSFGLYQNTDTFSDQQGAKATFKFNGTSIQYLGNRGPYHGRCRINIDGQDYGTVSSNAPADDTPILLYQKKDLSASEHTITVTVEDASYPNVCEVDRFIYQALDKVDLPSDGDKPPPSSSSTSIGPIVGGAVGGGVILILFILGIWLYRRRVASKLRNTSGGGAAIGAGVGGREKQSNKLRPNSTHKPTLPQVGLPAEDVGYTGGAIPHSPFDRRPMSQATSNLSTPPMSATGGMFPPQSATSTTGFLAHQHTGGADYATTDYAHSSAGYPASTISGPGQAPSPPPGPRAVSGYWDGQGQPPQPPLSPALFYNPEQGQQQQQPFRGPSPGQYDPNQRPSPSRTPDIIPAAILAAGAGGAAAKQVYAPVEPRSDYANASRREVEKELTPAERKRREVEEEARRRIGGGGAGGSAGGSGSGGQQQQPQPQQQYQQQQYQPQPQQQYQQPYQPPQQQYQQQQQQPQQQFTQQQPLREASQDQAQDMPAPPAYDQL